MPQSRTPEPGPVVRLTWFDESIERVPVTTGRIFAGPGEVVGHFDEAAYDDARRGRGDDHRTWDHREDLAELLRHTRFARREASRLRLDERTVAEVLPTLDVVLRDRRDQPIHPDELVPFEPPPPVADALAAGLAWAGCLWVCGCGDEACGAGYIAVDRGRPIAILDPPDARHRPSGPRLRLLPGAVTVPRSTRNPGHDQ